VLFLFNQLEQNVLTGLFKEVFCAEWDPTRSAVHSLGANALTL
jgi:hypothetical protein